MMLFYTGNAVSGFLHLTASIQSSVPGAWLACVALYEC